jgi:hypothetical protein
MSTDTLESPPPPAPVVQAGPAESTMPAGPASSDPGEGIVDAPAPINVAQARQQAGLIRKAGKAEPGKEEPASQSAGRGSAPAAGSVARGQAASGTRGHGGFDVRNEPPSVSAAAPSRIVGLLSLPLRILVSVLVVLDLPFTFLGPTIKTLVGGVAAVTALIAAATWTAGPRLVTAYVQRDPPLAETRQVTDDHGKQTAAELPAQPAKTSAASRTPTPTKTSRGAQGHDSR